MIDIASTKKPEDSIEEYKCHSTTAIKMQWSIKDHKSQMITSAKIVGDSRREYGHQSQMIASASTEEAGDRGTKRKGMKTQHNVQDTKQYTTDLFSVCRRTHTYIYIRTH